MSGKRRTEHPGHCKLTAVRIRRDARKIAARLAEGEATVKALTKEYGCNQATFRKHLTKVIGKSRWHNLIYHFTDPDVFRRPPKLKEEKIVEKIGPHCFICTKPITSDMRNCPNCKNRLWG